MTFGAHCDAQLSASVRYDELPVAARAVVHALPTSDQHERLAAVASAVKQFAPQTFARQPEGPFEGVQLHAVCQNAGTAKAKIKEHQKSAQLTEIAVTSLAEVRASHCVDATVAAA